VRGFDFEYPVELLSINFHLDLYIEYMDGSLLCWERVFLWKKYQRIANCAISLVRIEIIPTSINNLLSISGNVDITSTFKTISCWQAGLKLGDVDLDESGNFSTNLMVNDHGDIHLWGLCSEGGSLTSVYLDRIVMKSQLVKENKILKASYSDCLFDRCKISIDFYAISRIEGKLFVCGRPITVADNNFSIIPDAEVPNHLVLPPILHLELQVNDLIVEQYETLSLDLALLRGISVCMNQRRAVKIVLLNGGVHEFNGYRTAPISDKWHFFGKTADESGRSTFLAIPFDEISQLESFFSNFSSPMLFFDIWNPFKIYISRFFNRDCPLADDGA
jgi:hypothetical protein